jgi:hypothetical protein
VPRDNNAEPEESPYDRAIRVMNRRGGDRNGNDGNSGARERSTNPGDGAPGRSADAPTRVVMPNRDPSTYGNAYGPYGAYPRQGPTTRQPSRGNDNDGDNSPGISRSPAQDNAPGMSRPRGYNGDNNGGGGGAVRRNPGADSNNDGGDRGRRSDGDRGRRGGDSDGDSGGSSRERSGGSSGASSPRHGGSSDGGGSSAGRSSDRGSSGGGSSAGRSSDSGGRSGGGGAVRRHP